MDTEGTQAFADAWASIATLHNISGALRQLALREARKELASDKTPTEELNQHDTRRREAQGTDSQPAPDPLPSSARSMTVPQPPSIPNTSQHSTSYPSALLGRPRSRAQSAALSSPDLSSPPPVLIRGPARPQPTPGSCASSTSGARPSSAQNSMLVIQGAGGCKQPTATEPRPPHSSSTASTRTPSLQDTPSSAPVPALRPRAYSLHGFETLQTQLQGLLDTYDAPAQPRARPATCAHTSAETSLTPERATSAVLHRDPDSVTEVWAGVTHGGTPVHSPPPDNWPPSPSTTELTPDPQQSAAPLHHHHHLDWDADTGLRRDTAVVRLFSGGLESGAELSPVTAETARQASGQPVPVGLQAAAAIADRSYGLLAELAAADRQSQQHSHGAQPTTDAAAGAGPVIAPVNTAPTGLRQAASGATADRVGRVSTLHDTDTSISQAASRGVPATGVSNASDTAAAALHAYHNVLRRTDWHLGQLLGSGQSDYGDDDESDHGGSDCSSQGSEWETVVGGAGRDVDSEDICRYHRFSEDDSHGYESEEDGEVVDSWDDLQRVPAPIMHGKAEVWQAEPSEPPKATQHLHAAAQASQAPTRKPAVAVPLQGTHKQPHVSPGGATSQRRRAAHSAAVNPLWQPDAHLPHDKGLTQPPPKAPWPSAVTGGEEHTQSRSTHVPRPRPELHLQGSHVPGGAHTGSAAPRGKMSTVQDTAQDMDTSPHKTDQAARKVAPAASVSTGPAGSRKAALPQTHSFYPPAAATAGRADTGATKTTGYSHHTLRAPASSERGTMGVTDCTAADRGTSSSTTHNSRFPQLSTAASAPLGHTAGQLRHGSATSHLHTAGTATAAGSSVAARAASAIAAAGSRRPAAQPQQWPPAARAPAAVQDPADSASTTRATSTHQQPAVCAAPAAAQAHRAPRPAPTTAGGRHDTCGSAPAPVSLPSEELFNAIKKQLASLQATIVQANVTNHEVAQHGG